MKSLASIPDRIHQIRDRVAAALQRSGRPENSVTLIGISKTVGADAIQLAVNAGLEHLGENRIQEAEGKIPGIEAAPGGEPPTWHLVGHLQKNKAAKALSHFSWIHSVDSKSLISRLDRLAAEAGLSPTILIEVNLAGESSKNGVAPERIEAILEAAARASSLTLAGLMCVPPIAAPGATFDETRPYFQQLARLRDSWASRGYDLSALSMGMTNDFEVAIEEGATHVRVGRAIFGDRPQG
jgi:pyridoxal phosphate enzyme (YggS family)